MTSVSEVKNQILKIKNIIDENKHSFLDASSWTPTFTDNVSSAATNSEKLERMESDISEIKKGMKSNSNTNYSDLLLFNSLSQPKTTIVNNYSTPSGSFSNSGSFSTSSKSTKKEKEEEDSGISPGAIIATTVVAVPTIVATVGAIMNDKRFLLWFSGFETEMDVLNKMVDDLKFDKTNIEHLKFFSECKILISDFNDWKADFIYKSQLSTKVGTGATIIAGATSFFFGLTTLAIGVAISAVGIAGYGTYQYFKPENGDAATKFEKFLTNLNLLNEMNVIGSYPNNF